MDYAPVTPEHLQQIHQLNELFVDLVSNTPPDAAFSGLTISARRRLTRCKPPQRSALTALPRALFQLDINTQATGPVTRPDDSCVRCFALTVLAVAFNMVRDSAFAARVLFAGSAPALGVLARSQLAELIDYSTQPGLLTCPLLENQTPASVFLAQRQKRGAGVPRHTRIALGHTLTMLPANLSEWLEPGRGESAAMGTRGASKPSYLQPRAAIARQSE